MVASAMMPDRSDRVVAWAHHLLLFPLRLPGLSAEQAIRYGVSFDRGLFDAFGRFDETLRIGEDTDFLERTAVVGEPAWAPTVVTFHRSIESTRSLLRDQAIRGYRSANASGRYRDSPFRLAAESLRLPRTARRSARAALTGDERRLARSSLWLVRLGSLVRALGNLAALRGLRRLRLPRSVTARV
jgi:hypothetical protein